MEQQDLTPGLQLSEKLVHRVGVLEKIADFRKRYPETETAIDGGVKESNIAQIARTGVDVIYIGSAIFLQADPAAAYRRLQQLAGAG